MKLADLRTTKVDFIVIRESADKLFHTATVHHQSRLGANIATEETMRITQKTN